MRPPICAICDDRFGPDEGGLVSFAATDASRAWHQRASDSPGFTGHPPDLEWFCGKHVARARELADRSLPEALKAFREKP